MPNRVLSRAVVGLSLVASLGIAGCTNGSGRQCGWYDGESLAGTTVSVLGDFIDDQTARESVEGKAFRASLETFTACTDAQIALRSTGVRQSVGDAVGRALRARTAPDVAVVDRALMAGLGEQSLVAAPPAVVDALTQNYSTGWREQMSLGGTVYGVPVDTAVKSMVWYSPRRFEAAGYQVPATWDEMMTLTERIATDTQDRAAMGARPWCVGFASGDSSGWPGTDWVEDAALRVMGPEGYDQWVTHQVPFHNPQAAQAMARVGAILKNPRYVNGGLGSVANIAQTYHLDAARPVGDGSCFLHRQGAFVAKHFGAGVEVGPDADVWAFPLPPMQGEAQPVMGTGSLAVALADRPEVKALQTYLASSEWANDRAGRTSLETGDGWTSPNRRMDRDSMPRAVDRLMAEVLTDDQAVFRYDGSDVMPSEVGAKVWFPQMVAWVRGSSDQAVLDAVEKAWNAQ